MTTKTLRILGTRGIPASHGGFETFVEHLALHLVHEGWRVVVYCQDQGEGDVVEDKWYGVDRVRIPVEQAGGLGTIVFDWKATIHAARNSDLCLTLGYNTAVFCLVLRLKGIPNIINMDGIEWLRAKWGRLAKSWFWVNERLGCWIGTHLVADHPQIKAHLETRIKGSKISTIAYGAECVSDSPIDPVISLGLQPGKYVSVIARPEPENSILEIVQAFSSKPRGYYLVLVGAYQEEKPYHRAVLAAAGKEVRFVGAIYKRDIIQALRFHSLAYIHGHQVGGTNPSLVEGLGAGNAIIAHDNHFNRWVAGSGALYFSDRTSFCECLDMVTENDRKRNAMKAWSRQRFQEAFTWPTILAQYEKLLIRYLPVYNTLSVPPRRLKNSQTAPRDR